MEGLKKTAAIALCAAILCAVCSTAYGDDEETWTAYVSISDGYLNVRSKPGFDREIIGTLDPGEVVTVTGYDGAWTRIDAPFEQSIGYVKSEYLTDDLEAYGSYTNSSSGRVRVRSSIGGAFSEWLKAGKTVTVQSWSIDSKGVRWAFIGKGWVRGDCLTRVEGE